jgi:membrane glycosyltransferase
MKSINPVENSETGKEIKEKTYPVKDTGFEVKLDEKRENIASLLAITIVVLFAVMILSFLYLIFIGKFSTEMIEYINIVLPSITTLIGMVFGFYFSQSRIK